MKCKDEEIVGTFALLIYQGSANEIKIQPYCQYHVEAYLEAFCPSEYSVQLQPTPTSRYASVERQFYITIPKHAVLNPSLGQSKKPRRGHQ